MTLSSDYFRYHNGVFSAEISDFGPSFRFEQIYTDACDAGLVMVSATTGKPARFYISTEHDRDGDITHWTLKPTADAVRTYPGLAGTLVQVFND
jgi:hypothetical protein